MSNGGQSDVDLAQLRRAVAASSPSNGGEVAAYFLDANYWATSQEYTDALTFNSTLSAPRAPPSDATSVTGVTLQTSSGQVTLSLPGPAGTSLDVVGVAAEVGVLVRWN